MTPENEKLLLDRLVLYGIGTDNQQKKSIIDLVKEIVESEIKNYQDDEAMNAYWNRGRGED